MFFCYSVIQQVSAHMGINEAGQVPHSTEIPALLETDHLVTIVCLSLIKDS